MVVLIPVVSSSREVAGENTTFCCSSMSETEVLVTSSILVSRMQAIKAGELNLGIRNSPRLCSGVDSVVPSLHYLEVKSVWWISR